MTRRTVILVSPPVLHAEGWWANRIANKPHLDSLAGYVRDLADVRTFELDLTSEGGVDQLSVLDDAIDDQVALVGISCWTSLHYLGTLATAAHVRALAPHIPIVVGGHHATAMPSDFSREVCDFVVLGDGEHPLRSLCESWPERPDALQIISGGVFDQSNPDHIDWKHYARPEAKERAVWVGMSRGCAFKCRFCVEPQRGPTYSRYSVEDALRIVEGLLETHEPSTIAFSDPLFGSKRGWIEDFLAGLEERRLPLTFWAETRADLMTRELLDRFKRCNFVLDFGLDTGSETMVSRMEKASNPARYLGRTRELLDYANTIGLLHGAYIVFNFPGETPETAEETQRYVDAIGGEDKPMSGWLSCQSFFILPGTHAYLQMAHNAKLYGTEIRHPGWWREVGDHRGMATDLLPSAAWAGREEDLRAYELWNREVNTRWWSRYPPAVQMFRQTFFGG